MAEISSRLRFIKGFHPEIPVCYVEGDGDKQLLQTFLRYTRIANYDILKYIDVINGKTITRKGRIDTLIKNKIQQGEIAILILDGDGSKAKTMNSIKKLWTKKLVKKKNIYIFKHNIELAFPPDMLIEAVRGYVKQHKLRIKLESDEILDIIAEKGDFISNCKKAMNINIKKTLFDAYLGYLLAQEVEWKYSEIWEKKPPYHKYEIYQFLRFIVKLWLHI